MEATSRGWVLCVEQLRGVQSSERTVRQRYNKHTQYRGVYEQECPASRAAEQCKAPRQRSG
jgi:hypothetical protein